MHDADVPNELPPLAPPSIFDYAAAAQKQGAEQVAGQEAADPNLRQEVDENGTPLGQPPTPGATVPGWGGGPPGPVGEQQHPDDLPPPGEPQRPGNVIVAPGLSPGYKPYQRQSSLPPRQPFQAPPPQPGNIPGLHPMAGMGFDPRVSHLVQQEEKAMDLIRKEPTIGELQRQNALDRKEAKLRKIDPQGKYRRGSPFLEVPAIHRWMAQNALFIPGQGMYALDGKGGIHHVSHDRVEEAKQKHLEIVDRYHQRDHERQESEKKHSRDKELALIAAQQKQADANRLKEDAAKEKKKAKILEHKKVLMGVRDKEYDRLHKVHQDELKDYEGRFKQNPGDTTLKRPVFNHADTKQRAWEHMIEYAKDFDLDTSWIPKDRLPLEQLPQPPAPPPVQAHPLG